MTYHRLAWMLMGGLLAAPAAHAQAIRLPGSAEAGRIEQETLQPGIPQAKSSGPATIARPGSSQALVPPEGAENIMLTLKRIRVTGNTRYSDDTLLAAYRSLSGTRISIAKLYEVASSIQDRYRKDGYSFVLVYLPPQQIAEGEVVIRVTEGHISRVVYEGVEDTPSVREAVATLRAQTPLSNLSLEEQMLRVKDLPGVDMKAVLEADTDSKKEGALLLRLVGQPKRFNGQLAFNNYGSRYIGPLQSIASVSVNNQLGNNDRTTLSGFSAVPYSEGHFISIEHRQQLDLATSVGVRLSKSHNKPGYTLKPQEVDSGTTGITIDVQHQYLRSRAENLGFNASFGSNNYNTDILGTRLYNDRIRALRLSANYDTIDRWNGTSAVSVTASKGLDIFGARKTNSPDLSRAEGHSDFTKLEATAWHNHPLPERFSLYTLATGQVASDPLLASEEFGFGGASIGRAYDVAEITGDHGLAFTAELRYLGLPEWESTLVQPFAFYDAGWVWNMDTGGKRELAASAGLGARALINERVQLSTALAYPLKREVQAPQSGDEKNPRFSIGLSYSF